MNATSCRLTALVSVLLILLGGALAETATLSGIVTDGETKKTIAGANILLGDLGRYTTSDAGGRFYFATVSQGHTKLRATHVGYLATEIEVDASDIKTDLKVVMEPVSLPGPTVTITSTRVSLRRSAAAFSNITQQEISERYTSQDIPVLLSELPSTTYRSDGGNGIGYNYVNIRGFGQRRIAVSINGVPQNDPGDHNVYWIDFPDLASNLQDIQVQRGAGVSHYGSAAIGGTIDLVTSTHSLSPRLTVSSGLGSYNTQRHSIEAVSGLISDRFSISARISRLTSDGYRDQSWVKLNSFFLAGAYFGPTHTLRLNIQGGPLTDHLAYYGVPKSYIGASEEVRRANDILFRPDETEKFHQPQIQLLHSWQMSPKVQMSNTLFYIRGNGYFDFSGDWWADYRYLRLDDIAEVGTQLSDRGLDPSLTYIRDSILRWYVEKEQWGWIPRFSLKLDKVNLDLGSELRYHRSHHWGRTQKADLDSAATDLNGSIVPIQLPEDVVGSRRYYEYSAGKFISSAFIHATYDITPLLILGGDIQYTYKRYSMSDEKFVASPHSFSVPFSFINPRLGINYNVTDALNIYTTIARTSREPRQDQYYDPTNGAWIEMGWANGPNFDTTATGSPDYSKPLIVPETLTDLEFGIGFAQKKYRLGINLYSMWFVDELIKQGGIDKFGQPSVGNAEQTLHRGVELTSAWEPLSMLRLTANLTLSDNRLSDYTVHTSDTAGTFGREYTRDTETQLWAVSYDGNQIAGFPSAIANMRATYAMPSATVSMQGRYVGRQYTDNTERKENSVEPYWVFNASLAYRFSYQTDVTLRFHVNNIFSAKYATGGEGDQFFPAATRNFFFGVELKI